MRLTTTVAFLVLAGCSAPAGRTERLRDHRAFTAADSWYSPPPVTTRFTPIDKEKFAPVTDALQTEAQAALAELSAKQITPEEATRLVGHSMPPGGNRVL